MKTTPNLFNFVDMLRVSNNEINKIAAQDWTFDELRDFVDFIYLLGKQYRLSKMEELYRDFCRKANNYSNMCAVASLEEIENADWVDDLFLDAKLAAEDMAAELVLYNGIQFFSEVHR